MKALKELLFVFLLITTVLCAHSTKEWRSRSIYQLLTDRFATTDGSTEECLDLLDYCGGTFKGIENNLDYIQGMGFNAIWISPIPENFPGSYHGYHATDWYEINLNFGTKDDLKSLISAMHKRDMWLMVDVVFNHVGPVDMDFSLIKPFDKEEYYNDKCEIQNWGDQDQIENCRLFNLPDLNQDHPYVRQELIKWVTYLMSEYDIDGLRLDTVPEIKKDFWKDFAEASNTFMLGEAFNGNIEYVSSYQDYVPGMINYPLNFAMKDVFMGGQSMFKLRGCMRFEFEKFNDLTLLGVFTDNHDTPRFLGQHNDIKSYQNALAFCFFTQGIPILYYGSEQEFTGNNNILNREVLWTNMDTSSRLYKFIKTLNKVRNDNRVWNYPHLERSVADNFYSFTRGDVVIALTNTHDTVEYSITSLPNSYQEGTVVCNVLVTSDCTTIKNGTLDVSLFDGEPKVYVKQINLVSD